VDQRFFAGHVSSKIQTVSICVTVPATVVGIGLRGPNDTILAGARKT
jgi:hypothetical protein